MRFDHELKAEARRNESRGELARALQLYQEALRSAARDPDAMPDPTLHLKVADLQYRLGRTDVALEGYREAADLYRNLGLMVNAVAVWKKVERVCPGEPGPWLRLADLHLEMGLLAEARSCMHRFVEASEGADRASAPRGDGREAGSDEARHAPSGGDDEAPGSEVTEALCAFLDRDPDPALGVLLAHRLPARLGRPEALRTLREVYERAMGEGRVTEELERELAELEATEP